LRIALLVMIEPGGAETPLPRAMLRVCGETVARRQLTLAHALECRRVLCLARSLSAGVLDLQHAAEAAGMAFSVVTAPSGLLPQVSANDELIVFSDGLLASGEVVADLIGAGPAVTVQPIESGMAAGFERIDINHASAGLMRIPGRLVERLAELPSDCDVPSALTRIALQAGVAMKDVPASARGNAGWLLIRSEADAHLAEDALIDAQVRGWDVMTPGLLLSRAGVTAFGPSLLHGGHGSTSLTLGCFLLLAVALGAGWFGMTAAGFAFVGLAWIVLKAMTMVQRLEQAGLVRGSMPQLHHQLLGWIIDITIIVLVVWRSPMLPWDAPVDRVFEPLMLIGVLRLLERSLAKPLSAWCADRSLLALLLGLAALSDGLGAGVRLLALGLTFGGLVLAGGLTRLTRN
jgi:hypothetical protein